MSLDRQHGDVVFECDGCADTFETSTGDFDTAFAAVTREGWHALKTGDVWSHYCETCWRKL
jgi:hypothetical protein